VGGKRMEDRRGGQRVETLRCRCRGWRGGKGGEKKTLGEREKRIIHGMSIKIAPSFVYADLENNLGQF
jgi:hypothetical protein